MRFSPTHAGVSFRAMSLGEPHVSVSARSTMNNSHPPFMLTHTRREFAKLSLAALTGAGLSLVLNRLGAAETPAKRPGKPNSKVAGVQIGLNVPYSFANGESGTKRSL